MSAVAGDRKVGRAVPSAPWPVVRLADVTTKIGSGSTPRGGESVYRESGTPLIRSMNVHFSGFKPHGLAYIDDSEATKLNNVVVQAGDVLLNITGASIGRVTIAPDEMHGARVNQHVCIIRPKSGVNSRFLASFFASPKQQARVMNVQVGATRQALTKSVIEKWEVPLPPHPEQRRIVAEIEKQFTRLDAGVTALRRTQANLKRYRAAVLKAACEGYLVPSNFKNWKEVTVGESLQIIDYRGRTPPFSGSGIPHLRSQNIRHGKIVWRDLAYVTPKDFDEFMTRGLPEHGDLLFTTEAPMGEVAVAPTEKFSVAQRIMILRPNPDIFESRFLMAQLRSPQFQARLSKSGTGSTVTGVSSRNFQPMVLLVPPLEEQMRIGDEIERRLSVVDELQSVVFANIQRAARLRQSVLNRSFFPSTK